MGCTHALIELSVKYSPYRYICFKCGKLLKGANGIHLPNGNILKQIVDHKMKED